ncbi:MAG: hypothetical protein U5N58_00100 [Actinomycetota bacterium]|nr:hypothetical protein [Actinomycetota bacterium]
MFGGGKYRIEIEINPFDQALIEKIRNMDQVVEVNQDDGKIQVICDKDLRSEISKTISGSDSFLTSMNIKNYALEEIYLKYFKEE